VKIVDKKNYMYDFYLQIDLSRTKDTAATTEHKNQKLLIDSALE